MIKAPIRNAFEMSTQLKVDSTVVDVSTINTKITQFDNHISSLNTNAHGISNISGLQGVLDGKAASSHTHDDRYYTETEVSAMLDNKADIFTGYTGTVTIVTSVNFTAETVVTKTLTYSNGVLTEVV